MVEYPVPIRHQLSRDLEVIEWARRQGLRVPVVLASDPPTGRVVLEDFGENDAESTLEATPIRHRQALLERLLQPLAVLAGCDPAALPTWNPPLDQDRLRWELTGFELWYVRSLRSVPPPPGLSLWLDELAHDVAAHPVRICHRDYHLNNLMLLPDDEVGIIDIQDILVGPDTYDVVSLLGERAATAFVSADQRRALLERWAEQTGAGPGWQDRVRHVQVQRSLKVIGTFARFLACGRREYEPWLQALIEGLPDRLSAAAVPADVAAFLID